jgi:hypothetical protein
MDEVVPGMQVPDDEHDTLFWPLHCHVPQLPQEVPG